MAGAAFGALGRAHHYQGGMTPFVLVVAVLAAIGGVLFGFDVVRHAYIAMYAPPHAPTACGVVSNQQQAVHGERAGEGLCRPSYARQAAHLPHRGTYADCGGSALHC